MLKSLSNPFAGQPLSSKMIDELIDDLMKDPSPENKKYLALIDLDCDTYLYRFTHCDNHGAACAAAIQLHRNAGRPETAAMTCHVGGTCKENGCDCGGRFMVRTYGFKSQASTDNATSAPSQGVQ